MLRDIFLKILTIIIVSICAVGVVSSYTTNTWIIVHEGYLKSYTNNSLVFSDGYVYNGSYANKTLPNTDTFYALKEEYRNPYWTFAVHCDAYELVVPSFVPLI
jgi:hypothetical protein